MTELPKSLTDKQEMFNAAYLGLAAQEFRKSYKDVFCMYRAPNGDKCAFGHCVPDELYRSAMEGELAGDVLKMIEEKDICNHFGSFANRLQCCHDDANSPDDMKSRLAAFAKAHNLTVPEMPE